MLKGILAISGKPGLYKLISEGKNSIIVESLINQKRMPVYSSSNVSALQEIAIFTETDEKELKDVLLALKANNNAEPFAKLSNDELKETFGAALPDYDKERVYTSDMKKVISWYNLLLENNLLEPTEEDSKAEESETPATDSAAE